MKLAIVLRGQIRLSNSEGGWFSLSLLRREYERD